MSSVLFMNTLTYDGGAAGGNMDLENRCVEYFPAAEHALTLMQSVPKSVNKPIKRTDYLCVTPAVRGASLDASRLITTIWLLLRGQVMSH